jgi:hypothetical protein
MTLELEWSGPYRLKIASHPLRIYSLDHFELPTGAGCYIFGRDFGKNFEALYVGKAASIRRRVRNQLKNLPLMLHLQAAKKGGRVLFAGQLVSKPGQGGLKNIAIIERALIRHFLSEGHDLVNIKGVRLRRYEIESHGFGGIVPKLMFVDRG